MASSGRTSPRFFLQAQRKWKCNKWYWFVYVDSTICQTDFQKVILFARLINSHIPLPVCQDDFISLHRDLGEDFAAAATIGADWWNRKSLTFFLYPVIKKQADSSQGGLLNFKFMFYFQFRCKDNHIPQHIQIIDGKYLFFQFLFGDWANNRNLCTQISNFLIYNRFRHFGRLIREDKSAFLNKWLLRYPG